MFLLYYSICFLGSLISIIIEQHNEFKNKKTYKFTVGDLFTSIFIVLFGFILFPLYLLHLLFKNSNDINIIKKGE